MANTGFNTSSNVGGGDSDYNPTTMGDQQPTSGFGGGIGDRTQGGGAFGGESVQQPSTGDQYGSSGGYGQGSMPSGQGTAGPRTTTGGGNGDFLDKGVDFAEKKAGHEQVG